MIYKNVKSYVKFSEGKQTEFLREIKSKLSLTWIKIARILNINRSMIYFYLNEDSMMPYSSYIKLCKIASLDINKFKYDIFNIISKGSARIPKEITSELAEFILVGKNTTHFVCR